MWRGTIRVVAVLAATIAAGTAVALAAAPGATTGGATGVGHDSATVHGTVNPQGEATSYHFEYGTTSAYGSSTANASAGSGSSGVDVSAALSGLKADTTYHYRVVATSSQGTTNGADRTFATSKLPAPAVTTQAASSVTATSARLNGSVGPNGQETTYHFEYGLTKSYGSRTAEAAAGHGTGSTDVSAAVSGLAPGKTYHVRIVATSPGGTTAGADRSFTTAKGPVPVVSTSAPTQVRADSARLRGAVNPRGQSTSYHFEYGTTRSYGSRTAETGAGQGTRSVGATAVVGGLAPNTTYHFRLVATSSAGIAASGDRAFKTAKQPLALTFIAGPNPVVFGRPVSVAGRLTGTGNAGASVVLQHRAFPFTATWEQLGGPAKTDAGGAFGWSGLRFGIGTQLRVVTADYKLASRPATVAVAVRVKTRVSRYRVKRNRRVRFRGSFAPASDGAPFAIQKRKRGRWVTVAGGLTRGSRYSRRIRVRRGGRYRVYVRVTGGGLTSGIGRTVRLRTFV